MTGADGRDAGLAHVFEGRIIRLADFEVDDLPPLGFQLVGARQNLVGAFRLEMADSRGVRHGFPYEGSGASKSLMQIFMMTGTTRYGCLHPALGGSRW